MANREKLATMFVCVVVAMVAGTTISTVLTGLWNMIATIVRIISNA